MKNNQAVLKKHNTNFVNRILIIITIVTLAFLSVVLYYHSDLELKFDTLISLLKRLDVAIANLDTHGEIMLCIAALYVAKCQLPIPLSFLCVISGMVFPLWQAIIINIVGIIFFLIVKYWEGIWIGGGWAGMILNIKKMRFIRDWIHFKGNGNPRILCVTRLIPVIPFGMVSKYYGSMRYNFWGYIALSLLGFAPRLYVYTKLGAEIYNPFSVQFITLLMIVIGFTGISSIIFNVFYGKRSNQMNQTLLIYTQKEKYRIVL